MKKQNNGDKIENKAIEKIKPEQEANSTTLLSPNLDDSNNTTSKNAITSPSVSSEKSGSEKKTSFTKADFSIIAKTACILIAITVTVALLLSLLNSLTAPVIEKRLLKEKTEAVEEFFGQGINMIIYDSDAFDPIVLEAGIITDADGLEVGYVVTATPKGFGGTIEMMVAVNTDGSVRGVKILSMSESGPGPQAAEDSFLNRFNGKTAGITLNDSAENSIDAVSGATKSSKAVLNGVNAALEAVGIILSDAGGN